MISSQPDPPGALHLRLPATSANLGPGFDTLGLALSLYLTVDAEVADRFSILATGRDAAVCSNTEESLILKTYRDLLESAGAAVLPLRLVVQNEIPLGMGLGSSAAALLAGVVLANHFGRLGWTSARILHEACRREGHPDNVAACFHGGMTASSMGTSYVDTATCGEDLKWRFFVAVPSSSLSTAKARALLPDTYSRADAISNVQRVTLLTLAFAQDRGELLRAAMQDRLHQPYRMQAAPLLPRLLPLGEEKGVFGVCLSGAGPSVLVVAEADASSADISSRIKHLAGDEEPEILEVQISGGAVWGEV